MFQYLNEYGLTRSKFVIPGTNNAKYFTLEETRRKLDEKDSIFKVLFDKAAFPIKAQRNT